ncbi:MAG TPA: hypothetical protein DCZ91_05360 [Lachnospiraceae bacterium]|nr:hypothetical protein [Lachnospiraceae bacterium]
MESIQLTLIDRQLLLYDIFRSCREVSYEEITARLPVGQKMIQRDIRTLTDAGLICVKYSRKEKAYMDSGQTPAFCEDSKGKRYAHLKKLNRIATLMTDLAMDSESRYEDDGDEYFSCKKRYYELFPNANEKMRQRDFTQLNRIGYRIYYDNSDRRYRKWESDGLREDFGVYRENGKLMRCTDSRYDMW